MVAKMQMVQVVVEKKAGSHQNWSHKKFLHFLAFRGHPHNRP